MAHYLYQNNDVNVFPQDAINIKTKLEPAIYSVNVSMAGYYLTRTSDAFTMPEKVYGDMLTHAKRIIETFVDRSKKNLNTGALLSGIKGSGKTLQVKTIANMLVKHMPVLMVNHSFSPNGLSEFLNTIDARCCVIFDEFEKNFSSNDSEDADRTAVQNGFLTMLDGTSTSTKLFLFTCNDLDKINTYLLNRPGRIFYHFKFEALSDDTLTMYAEDRLNNKTFIEDLQMVKARLEDSFTFDIMQSIVEESNRYNEAPSKFLRYMNLRGEHGERRYNMRVESLRNDVDVLIQTNDSVWIDMTSLDDVHDLSIWVGVKDRNSFKYCKNTNFTMNYISGCAFSDINELRERATNSTDAIYDAMLRSGYTCFAKVYIRVNEHNIHLEGKHFTTECDGFKITYEPIRYTKTYSPFAF